jgi:hypothetical protein
VAAARAPADATSGSPVHPRGAPCTRCVANPEFLGSTRAENGGEAFVHNGGVDFAETG